MLIHVRSCGKNKYTCDCNGLYTCIMINTLQVWKHGSQIWLRSHCALIWYRRRFNCVWIPLHTCLHVLSTLSCWYMACVHPIRTLSVEERVNPRSTAEHAFSGCRNILSARQVNCFATWRPCNHHNSAHVEYLNGGMSFHKYAAHNQCIRCPSSLHAWIFLRVCLGSVSSNSRSSHREVDSSYQQEHHGC